MSILPNPFASVSPGDLRGSLPSGESEPSVTLACSPGESRFVLDEEAFLNDIEPLPAFLSAPSLPYRAATELKPVLSMLAKY